MAPSAADELYREYMAMYTLAGVDQTDYPTPAPTNPTPTPTVQHLTVVDEYFIGGLVVAFVLTLVIVALVYRSRAWLFAPAPPRARTPAAAAGGAAAAAATTEQPVAETDAEAPPDKADSGGADGGGADSGGADGAAAGAAAEDDSGPASADLRKPCWKVVCDPVARVCLPPIAALQRGAQSFHAAGQAAAADQCRRSRFASTGYNIKPSAAGCGYQLLRLLAVGLVVAPLVALLVVDADDGGGWEVGTGCTFFTSGEDNPGTRTDWRGLPFWVLLFCASALLLPCCWCCCARVGAGDAHSSPALAVVPGALTLTFFLAATAVWASGTEHCGPALWTAYYVFLVYVAVAAPLALCCCALRLCPNQLPWVAEEPADDKAASS